MINYPLAKENVFIPGSQVGCYLIEIFNAPQLTLQIIPYDSAALQDIL